MTATTKKNVQLFVTVVANDDDKIYFYYLLVGETIVDGETDVSYE